MKIQPRFNRVLVKRDETVTKTKGGIVVAEMAQEQGQTGTVLATGDMVFSLSAGDRVMFGKYAGLDLASHGPAFKGLVLFHEEDILAECSETQGYELLESGD